MAYTETTSQSYGSRLSGSFKGIGAGLLLFLAATVLLFWNEGRAVKTAKSIKEAESIAVHVDDVSTVNPDLEGKLIHASAKAETQDVLQDDMFGASVVAIKLHRDVEYYQWVEEAQSQTKEKVGGGTETVTTYSYKREWTNDPVSSASFHDPQYANSNFTLMNLDDEDLVAENVTFGAYVLPDFIKSSISGSTAVKLEMTDDQCKVLDRQLYDNSRAIAEVQGSEGVANQNSDSYVPGLTSLVAVRNNVVFLGRNANSPQVGDVRVTITAVLPADISLIAKVTGQTFEPYVSDQGKNFSRVEMGTVSMENMFEGAKSDNKTLTWILRVLGLVLVIAGLKSLFSFLPMLLKWLPFLGKIADAGVGLVCSVGGFVWALIVAAVAWLFYRPVLGIILLVVAVAGIIFLRKKSKDNDSVAAASPASPVNLPKDSAQ